MADLLQVKLEGVKAAMRKLDKLGDDRARRRVTQAAIRAGVRPLTLAARRNAPVGKGALRKQLKSTVKRDRGSVVGRVRAKITKAQKEKGVAPAFRYLHLVTGGAKPHVIRNVVINGRFYHAINHPGIEPNDFIEEAANTTAGESIDTFAERFSQKMLQEMAMVRGRD